jgi:protein involved in polysaccharide export with SLBB domain
MTVLRAIDTAQGFTDFARKTSIEVRRVDGRTEFVNWKKARANPKLDLPIYPNDHIIVPKGI